MEAAHKERLSKSEAYSLIEEYYSSGELPSVFYRRVGWSDNQFYGWRKKYLRDHPSLAKKIGVSAAGKSPRNASYQISAKHTANSQSASASNHPVPESGFARIAVSERTHTCTPSAITSGFELCYPNGIVLRLPMGVAASYISELIKCY